MTQLQENTERIKYAAITKGRWKMCFRDQSMQQNRRTMHKTINQRMKIPVRFQIEGGGRRCLCLGPTNVRRDIGTNHRRMMNASDKAG